MGEITVRGIEIADWEDLAEIFLAPKCRWGTLQLPYQSRDDIKKRIEEPGPGLRRLVAVDEERGKVAGVIVLHCGRGRRAHTAMIGMMVHDDYQGRGIGARLLAAAIDLAENWLNLTRLELTVFTDNPGAIHLYEKHGFVIEGTLRNYAYRDGVYVDAYEMARIRD